jgi:hypothetical protein
MGGLLSQVRCCDPDEGLSGHFRRDEWGLEEPGFVFIIGLLWILLGFLLLPPVMRRGSSGHATWWDPFGALFLFPLSLFSTVLAIDVYYRYHGWAIAVPILLPPLIGLYGIWARFPHTLHRADVTSAVVWGAMLVLTIAPLPLAYLDARASPNRESERTAEFRRLTPDSTLLDYMLFRPSEPRREDWFEGVRRVKSRQTDAVVLLKRGSHPTLPSQLYRFGLEATPSLCEAFHEQLREKAAKIEPLSLFPGSPGDANATRTAIYDVSDQLRTIKWLVGAHCDLSDTLTDIETKLRAVHGSHPEFIGIDTLNTLAALRQTR